MINNTENAQKKSRLCELLARPAANRLSGSRREWRDVVYVGGSLFNARAGAQNFNHEQPATLSRTHQRGVHAAMNILLRR